ncbi:MAG: toxin TcdB middle/N-terminal domain-containing protein, partial [Paludibacteraceae bacterium]|nr:toxin TcdB middle/N-terminal domain-containing protein [Paludibacteraceae bacterium]
GWTVEAYEFTEIEKKKTDEYGNEVTYTETVKNQIYESSVSGLNVVSNLLDESFGPMYRGWGQFAYSAASDRYGKNIDETRLGASAYNDMTDGYDPENPESFEYDKDKLVFIAMQPDFLHDRWNGQASYELGDDTITNSVGKELMITARQGEQDVTVADPFASVYSGISLGGKGIAFSIISESKSTTTQRGIGGYTKNVSDGTSATIQSSVDMNGDGYPDLIKDSNIFYTGHLGGFDGVTKNFGEISLSDNGDSHSESSAFGSGTIHAIPGMVKQFRAAKSNNNVAADESASEKARAKINVSLGSSENKERTTQTKMDMNGDGLLDIVSNTGSLKVRLNLGYDFSPEIVWGIYPIRSVSAEDKTIGGSVDFCGSSYSAGLNASGSTSFIENDLIDVNGDGLPDLLTNDAVFLNTGFGFGERVLVKNLSSVGTSTSINGSVNGNATASIPAVFVRFVISGGAAFGKGLSGEEASIRDFDGDGYPDMVTSNSKNSIKVDTSNIGATNKLKSVTTPFGGKYELEYIHSIPTQQHPGGKWVMSKLTVTDTQRDINDCPPVVSVFDYAGGKRDRRERDFYGFAEVRTKRMNVNDEGKSVVESQIVQNYDTTNYYTSGTAIGSYVCDANQQQFFSKETSKLNMYDVSGKGNVTNGREVSATASFDENGRYFVAPFESTTKRFEEDSETTTNIVENTYGDFGNLTEYKYTDGITNASYTTTIQYKDYDEETGVFGLPTDVEVKSGDQTMRHVTAEYDGSGYNPTSMTKMTQYLGGETAEVEFKYDTLGNIIEKIMPKATGGNLMNKRMTYTYEYDKKHRMYPTRVTDGFGYRSDMFNYDYRYGIPLSVKDINGFITEY